MIMSLADSISNKIAPFHCFQPITCDVTDESNVVIRQLFPLEETDTAVRYKDPV